MRKSRRYLAIGLLSAAFASLVAYAAQPSLQGAPAAGSSTSAAASPRSGSPPSVWVPPRVPIPFPTTPPSPTREEVGDVESFGRPLKWLGVTQIDVYLSRDCAAPQHEDGNCERTDSAFTQFSFQDVGDSITLPGNAAHSLLCHWLSPMLSIEYANPGPEPVTAGLFYSPKLRIQSEVLLDPWLVDPTTGRPFNGSLLTSVSSSAQLSTVVLGGEQRFELQRGTNTCIAGFLTRRQLVETYGLTEAQAAQVFAKPITISMQVHGHAENVAQAQLTLGLRIVGD
ncbi:hypothetical protein ACFONC_00470 [Luteimonas soli]|uniref:Uncharacterized protein n=1 Tax=Luteimonas soli TaxID=1648966 RepID=A0ABV7XEN2_9GAMM